MSESGYSTPLLAPDSPLDEHSRKVIQEVYNQEQAKALELPSDDPLDPKRRRRVELTWGEMMAQPQAIQTTLTNERYAIREAAGYFTSQSIERIYLVGCGDSIASMIAVRTLFENLFGIPCEPVQALDFTYYYHRPVSARTPVITLSSSGATTRTVEAMMLGRALGAPTLALSNTPGSPLMRESDRGLLIHAERKGWPTQSSTAAMAILVQLGLDMAKARDFPAAQLADLQIAFDCVPDHITQVLERQNSLIKEVAEKEAKRNIYLYAGGGSGYACALFGAAKVKECSPDHGLAIQLEEYHHYNSQKAGDPLFLVAPASPSMPRALDTAREGKRWGGQIYSLVSEKHSSLTPYSDQVFYLPAIPEFFVPFVYTVPLQLFAYHVAMEKFRLAEI